MRRTPNRAAVSLLLVLLLAPAVGAQEGGKGESPYSRWTHGPPADETFFPIGVWLQNPRHATRYRNAGINTYVGLWRGPTEKQLADLKAARMRVMCAQNSVGLAHRDDRTIIGWLQQDEPDNAQWNESRKRYDPPILPEEVVRRYRKMKDADPTRPVLLNLGQGVARDHYRGRGVRSRHPEDYARYVEGGDLVSFDIYPVVHRDPEVKGKLWFVAQGVTRLRRWAGSKRVVWNVVEASRIHDVDNEPTAEQLRAEVWMSLIHGSRGIVYFVHQFKPRFKEAALLDNPKLLSAVTAVNRRITELAPVLNRPSVRENREGPVAWMVKEREGSKWLFAVEMKGASAKGVFSVPGVSPAARAEVLGEDREVTVTNGGFEDGFSAHAVHIYKVR